MSGMLLLMIESRCVDVGHSTGELRVRMETIISGSLGKGHRNVRGAVGRWGGWSKRREGRRWGRNNSRRIR
jgi:hypothetical protein